MEQRLNYPRLAPEANRAMTALGSYLATCGLEHPLLELIKIRASPCTRRTPGRAARLSSGSMP